MRHHATGLLLWGREQFAYRDQFDPEDPETPESWRTGVIGLAMGPRPKKPNVMYCPKVLHLGWVGIALNCHLPELADFVLGWTTLDIMGDDGVDEAETVLAANVQ